MSNVLSYDDGAFQCTAEHAVEVAAMMSMLEACLIENVIRESTLTTYIVRYLQGDMNAKEVYNLLCEYYESKTKR